MKENKLISYLVILCITLCCITTIGTRYPIFAEDNPDDYYYEDEDDYVCDNHRWEDYFRCVRKATVNKDGVKRCYCELCDSYKEENFKWKLAAPNSRWYTSYNSINCSTVYANSKTVTVKLHNAVKGSIVKVKIGKRTYKKKVKSNGKRKKITIKINNPKMGNKVIVKLYFKGKLIGKNYEWVEIFNEFGECEEEGYERNDDIVYFAKNIKKGMTKTQVKYCYNWGSPSSTGSYSNGMSYWYYDDGSYVGFKNGKVRSWYNASW